MADTQSDKIKMVAHALCKADPRLTPAEAQALASGVLDITDRGKRERWNLLEVELQPVRKRLSPLTKELRSLREAAGLTQVAAEEELGWYHNKVMRIESGKVAPTKADLLLLLRLYRASTTSVELVAKLAGVTFGRLRP